MLLYIVMLLWEYTCGIVLDIETKNEPKTFRYDKAKISSITMTTTTIIASEPINP